MWHEEKLLIDGELVVAENGRTFETVNPATGKPLGAAADASIADTERAVSAARQAFDNSSWSTDLKFRAHCLRQLHEALVANRDSFAELIAAEVGAPEMLCQGPQLDSPVEMVEWYADLVESYEFTEDLGEREFRGRLHHRWIEREPVGVVGAIIPYNYPIQITLAKLAPALAAGCTVVVKGAPETPWTVAGLGRIVAEHTDIPAGVVNVLTGASPAVGEALVTDPRVDMISFTGSTATGRRIMATASETVKKLFLELGGKSAFIVLDDADLGLAAMMAGFTICSHAGQGCAITSRLLVPRSRYEEVVGLVRDTLAGVPYGDPSDPSKLMGPLISERQREKVDSYVRQAVADGATVAIGGKVPDGLPDGYFYEPTLLIDVDPSSVVAQDEIFGPVLVVLTYDDDDDAVRIANDSIFGLSAAVFGTDTERARSIARRLRTGTVSINGGSYYGPDAPFGGYKQSGFGREMGRAGLAEYLQLKTLAEPAG